MKSRTEPKINDSNFLKVTIGLVPRERLDPGSYFCSSPLDTLTRQKKLFIGLFIPSALSYDSLVQKQKGFPLEGGMGSRYLYFGFVCSEGGKRINLKD